MDIAHDEAGRQAQHANELLERFIIKEFRSEHSGEHIGECLELAVADLDGRDGSYGCDTGCEYLQLQALITCPHAAHSAVAFTYGEFGDMAGLIEALEKMDR